MTNVENTYLVLLLLLYLFTIYLLTLNCSECKYCEIDDFIISVFTIISKHKIIFNELLTTTT